MAKCFVVMGFGEKMDLVSQRKLDLDKTYKNIIKPAVEEAGLECIRADDVRHSGVIDAPMYENLLEADVVVADLSTANANAIYELGVRHALKPNTTIIIAESNFKFPFDLSHVAIQSYEHLGVGIDFDEVMRMKGQLKELIETIMATPPSRPDSPVYEFLNINPPTTQTTTASPSALTASEASGTNIADQDSVAFGVLLAEAQAARAANNFATAIALFTRLRELNPTDPYLTQQLALATYKEPQTSSENRIAALNRGKAVLEALQPKRTNDAETLGLWGAIHKRLWEEQATRADLDESIWAYERGYYLKNDYYNGINYAFMLNVRAQQQDDEKDRITDRVLASRVREHVLVLVDEAEAQLPKDANGQFQDAAEAYWLKATRAEALCGLGRAELDTVLAELFDQPPEPWMPGSTDEQLGKLTALL